MYGLNDSDVSPCYLMHLMRNLSNLPEPHDDNLSLTMDSDMEQNEYYHFRNISYGIILPCILAFGIIGNAINIAVFSKKKMWVHQDVMEKSARVGLISLAIADLLFCVVGFPSAFVEHGSSLGNSAQGTILALYYTTYRAGLLNVFVFMSTWFIISLSMERYFAVLHPFRAKNFITIRRTLLIKLMVVILAILINIPDFLRYSIRYDPCLSTTHRCGCYYAKPNHVITSPGFSFVYRVTWHVLGTFLPLFILMFCNVCLLSEIYKSASHDKSQGIEARDPTKITFILISIVTLFFVLVCPSMILSFLAECVMESTANIQHYQIAVVVTNLAQALNFAINFLLYCALSPKFRQEFHCSLNSGVVSDKVTGVKASKVTTLNVADGTHV